MALPATDNFNRADGSPGANWTAVTLAAQSGGMTIVSNALGSVIDNYGAAIWTADTLANNQYAQAVLTPYASYCGPVVRASAGLDGYMWNPNFGADGRLYRVDDGGLTQLVSGLSIPANGSTCRLEAESSTLRVYDDGAQVGTDTTDATYASGTGGLWAGGSYYFNDDFEMGDLAGGIVVPVFRRHYQLMERR